ncbi:hypothetical protein PCL_06041 [Purpureocillium lilacinum]|uniref:Uncharacterized protein n=1 Tax=Purpureocillium lilacinum TaxID=33203 RepID=A0A2U3ELL6_PURLI|nr:hypothetical protein PCL_06041 [Purpureocillium lilacinum]
MVSSRATAAATERGLDVGFGGSCCENTHYCYVNKQSQPRCCPIGSNCVSDSNCSSDRFQCTSTASVAVTVTASSGRGSNTDTASVTVFTTASAQVGCCGRACPQTSQYLCPKDLGGACCSFGFDCRSGGQCVETKKPGPSSGTLTPVVDGCTTSQFKCPDGAGCCDEWMHCTRVSDKPYCAPGNPTNTNVRSVGDVPPGGGGGDDSTSDARLSGGAKAGIGVGVAVAGGLVLGLAAWWFCVRRRRRRAGAGGARKDEQPDPDRDPDAAGPNGWPPGSDIPRDAAHRPIGIGEMSETTASQRPRLTHGLTDDYFGPVSGPYTEASDAGRSTTSPAPQRPGPEHPQGAEAIAVPVEIDSSTATPAPPPAPATPTPSTQHLSTHPFPHPETTDGLFELYGSEAQQPPQPSPSLLTTGTTPGTPASEGPRKADK